MLQVFENPSATTNTAVEASRQGAALRWRLVAALLVGVIGFLGVAAWQAPNAEARKKRKSTPTTIAGENASSTTVVRGSPISSATEKPAKAKPAKSGDSMVFPGAGKRDNAPATIASKPKPTLVASATPVGSAKNPKPATTSNRTNPRLRAIGFRSRTKLEQHYEKHGREFGNITIEEYLAMAQDLRDAPLSDRVVEANQVGGTISRFDRKTGGFTAFDRDLTIRTFFKPNGGENYFRRAATKAH